MSKLQKYFFIKFNLRNKLHLYDICNLAPASINLKHRGYSVGEMGFSVQVGSFCNDRFFELGRSSYPPDEFS